MSFRRILGITLLLAVIGPTLIVVGALQHQDPLVHGGFLCLAAAACWLGFHLLRSLARRLLYRVGNRLFVSYLLIGVVPIVLVFCLIAVLTYLLTGQLAAKRVEGELQLALAGLRSTSAAMAAELEVETDSPTRHALFQRLAPPLPGLGWALRTLDGGLDGEGPLDPALLLPEGRIETSLEAVGRLPGGQHFLAVVAPPGAAGSLIVYRRIEPELRQSIEAVTEVSVGFPQALAGDEEANLHFTINGQSMVLEGGSSPEKRALPTFEKAPPPVAESGLLGQPFVYFPRSVELPYVDWSDQDWHAAIEGGDQTFSLMVQTSMAREYIELFESASADDINTVIGRGAVQLPLALSIATLVLYCLAAVVASLLVYRIARATSRLHRGFAEVERGNFQVQLKLRGRDQLAGLVQSFNRMAKHLSQAIEDRAEREAIERELEIARQLQRSLLPPADFCAPGFEIAADFLPAAAIGGDFYHFVRREDGRLLVAIADVSGHGLSTGIVMSAAKALLSALATDYCPCAELLRRLDRELCSHTGRRHFVTLGLCTFDLAEGRVELTNAGHPYPYRLQPDGTLTALENPSRPLAVALPQDFRSTYSATAPGDLWVLYSDGVIEAQSPSGEVFGFTRFENLLASCAGKSAAATRDTLLAAWREFVTCECPEDDRTLLVLKVLG